MNNSKLVAIVDYKTGNTASVANAVRRVGGDYIITDSKSEIKKCSHIILPGVGSFKQAIENLKNSKLISTIEHEVFNNNKKLLGICVGMQLMFENSNEDGFHEGLGWFRGLVKKIVTEKKLILPHVGWNKINIENHNTVKFKDCKQLDFYFDHNYECIPQSHEYISSTTDYGKKICASIQDKNISAVQFHPEKSQLEGLRLFNNFVNND